MPAFSAADYQPHTKFGNIEFPGEVWRLRLVGRHYVHLYPHQPGGAAEKLGRGPYNCTVHANFQDRFSGYPGLYPDAMNTLRGYAENQTTLPFVHPSSGTFPAFIVNWDQEKTAKLRSGEKVEIEFLEDQAASFALAALAKSDDSTRMGPSAQQLADELAAVQSDLALTTTDLSIFDALQGAVNVVLGLKDTVQLYGNRYAGAVQQVANLCQQIDGLASMQDARAFPVIDALRQLQFQTIMTQKDLQNQQQPTSTFTVPFTQPLVSVALAVYQDASRLQDLLTLNPNLDNAMRVRAGTKISYYPVTPQQRAAQSAA